MNTVAQPRYLTPKEVAAMLRTTEGTLANWRYLGKNLDYLKVGGLPRYEAREVERYIKRNTHRKTGYIA